MDRSKSPRIRGRSGRIPSILALLIVTSVLGGIWLMPFLPGTGAGQAQGAGTRARKPVADRHKPVARPKKPTRSRELKPTPTPTPTSTAAPSVVSTPWVVLGYSELGMHCMNQDDSEICILPPYNNFHAQVIARGAEPQIITSNATVSYSIPGNTTSANKSNFWMYAKALFGVNLAPDVGLTGNRLSGVMSPTANGDWLVTGIPLTPVMDDGTYNPFALSRVNVTSGTTKMATTQAVVPVSWEISCNLCHNTPGISTASDILLAHDRLHGTNLQNQKPVLCAGCHADPALGTTGVLGVSTMSSAMHTAHATRFTPQVLQEVGGINCYACHPGINTQCQRDIHLTKGIHCGDCHGTMSAVGNPARKPWVDEPKCGNCHNVAGHQYEEPGKLFKESRGHNGVMCAACHGSPHAITPTVTAPDNVQAITLQGYAGTIDNCVVCHKSKPDDSFNHTLGEGGGGGGGD